MPNFNELQDRPLFIGVESQAFNNFAQVAKYQEYQPGEVIIKEGEQKDALMVIEKGQVEVSKGDLSLYDVTKFPITADSGNLLVLVIETEVAF